MKIKNIGIYAHVDAGKTTITEQVLFHTGIIKTVGRVDKGNTYTDSMDLERQRGISIQAAPVSFALGDTKINLIDTPGHADFIAEVERSMQVLDGAILVISALEGVQSHTTLLFEALRKQHIPTIIFVNKIDRVGIQLEKLLGDIKQLLSPMIIPVQRVEQIGSNECSISGLFDYDQALMIEKLTKYSDELLEDYLNNQVICDERINKIIVDSAQSATIYPLLWGSALRGIGVPSLLEAILHFLPFAGEDSAESLEPAGIVFKIKRNSKNEKQNYIRLYRGQLLTRSYLEGQKITKIERLLKGREILDERLLAGDIGIVYGVDSLKVGGHFGPLDNVLSVRLGEPMIKVQISPEDPSRRHDLLDKLVYLAEEDRFLEYEISELEGEIYLNIFGEIQMEIIRDRLLGQYDLAVTFSDPMTIYRETPVGVGEAYLDMSSKEHPFHASIGIRVQPGSPGSGIIYRSAVSTGSLPRGLQRGIEDGVHRYLSQGLKGWEVMDATITVTRGEYDSVMSTGAEFRNLAPIVYMRALQEAGTELLWPLYDFSLHIPRRAVGRAISDLNRMQAVVEMPQTQGDQIIISGKIPVDTCRNYELELRSYTAGQGVFMTQFSGYQPAPKSIDASRRKSMISPLDLKLYLLNKRGVLK